MALTSMALTFLSGLAMKSYIARRASHNAAIMAGVIYMALPYHFIAATMTRNAIGEQAAYIFMPLAFLATDRLTTSTRAVIWLAFAVSGLILSHLATTLLFAPLLISYCLHAAWRAGGPLVIKRTALAAGLAAALSTAYTLPALTMGDMIRTEFWDFWSPSEAFLFVPSNDLSRIPAAYAFAIHLSAGLTLALIGAAAIGLAYRRRYGLLAFWGGAQTAYIFMNTSLSRPIWEAAEIFNRIEFLWRSLSVMELATTVMIFSVIGASARRIAVTIAICLTAL